MTPEQRLEICKKCEFYDSPLRMFKDMCRLCGCYVPIKVKNPLEKCPEGKW